MIDVESQIYTPIAEALRAQFPGILVSGEYGIASRVEERRNAV